MNRKKIYKISLSLLIAALFIFTSVSAISTTSNTVEKGEASDEPETTRERRVTEQREIVNEDVQSLQPPGLNLVTIAGLSLGEYDIEFGEMNIIPSGTYPITVDLFNDADPEIPENALVKVFAEVYKKCCGEEVLMYETSFEDNFDIYNNWMQIDIDCGMDPDNNVGFFDTWTWTDARAYCDDHSFKNTMYAIYKGNQDDYLMCTRSFDVRDQYGVKVNFKIWVEGQGDTLYQYGPGLGVYSIFDYLDFEVGDWNGNWVNPWNINTHDLPDGTPTVDMIEFLGPDLAGLPGGYNFHDTTVDIHTYSPYQDYYPKAVDLGGGWWDVTFDAPNWYLETYLGLDLEDIMFRFSWHSDPQFQFEGAYVDCFEVWSLEDCEIKVFQTHSQGPIEVPPCRPEEENFEFEFPLMVDLEFIEECGRKETCYDIVVWMEVINPILYWTLHDWIPPTWWELYGYEPWEYPGPQDYLVCVGDYFDVCIENLEIETSFGGRPVPPEGAMYEGEDAHIMADVHIAGTLPAENIVINAKAEEKEWVEIFSTECENMLPWSTTYGYAHATDQFAWSGSKSLGFFDKVENEYPVGTPSYVYGPTVDLADYEEVFLDYYAMFATETTFDYCNPIISDPYANFVLGSGYHAGLGTQSTGWSGTDGDIDDREDWIGPMQPRSVYQSCDLKAQWQNYFDQGFFRDPAGNTVTKVQIGFYFSSDGPWYGDSRDNHNTNQLIGWSGVCIDDISIRGLKIGETVWSDRIIIPGPCEPSETCTVQFEWEDVPFSDYKITVSSGTDGACLNFECESKSQQIRVITDLERAHYKEVDSVDLTGGDGGPWGRCSSDYDYYLSTNPDSIFYDTYADYTATLCLDGVPCLDLSDYMSTGSIMEFDAWWDLAFLAGTDYVAVEVADCVYEDGSCCGDDGYCCPDELTAWTTVASFSGTTQGPQDDDGWVHVVLDLSTAGLTTDHMCVRFVMHSNAIGHRGFLVDDLVIIEPVSGDIIFGVDTDGDGILDAPDPMDTMDNYCFDVIHYGQYWYYEDVDCCGTDGGWFNNVPALPVNDALIWGTEIMDAYEAELTILAEYSFSGTTMAYLEISDSGGSDWFILAEYTGSSGGCFTDDFNLNFWVGKPVLIRIRVHGGLSPGGGFMNVCDLAIIGKEDNVAPTSSIQMSGTMKESGWYNTGVKVVITAEDQGSGVREIHYVVDGSETVVAGDTATFTINSNGFHDIVFWAVDNVGNAESQHIVPTFKIDAGAAPTVAITAPEPGLYLFGNKILSISNVFIIGAFTIEADAEDIDSGIYKVSFYLDDELMGEDTEAPFSQYVAVRHMGAGTIKVVAEDFAQNVAEDTLDIKYYKFF